MAGAVLGLVNSTKFSPLWVSHYNGDQTIDRWVLNKQEDCDENDDDKAR